METNGIAPIVPAAERRQRTPLSVTRERVLGTADRLFRRGGVQAVSVDAIAQAADIKKMTLYRCFSSKEELVMACMDQWEEAFQALRDEAREQYPEEPARQVLALFQRLVECVSSPEYGGTAFINLLNDYPDPAHPISLRVREQRASLRAALRDQLARAEASEPMQLADACCLLLEGLFAVARTYGPDSEPVRNTPAVLEKMLRQGCGSSAFPPEPRRFRRW